VSQALYRQWRPQSWDEVIGQDHVVQTLRNAVRSGQVAHAFLFAGPRGTGKTSTARLLAKAVNCTASDPGARPCNACELCLAVNQGRFLDLIEIDAASNTSVEDVRSLRDKINFAPNQGRHKVYIIDEVHMLSTAAFNALLKTLEEPPAHALFILATTEVHKIPATVLSRCQRHEFRRLPVQAMVSFLSDKAGGLGLDVEPKALEMIARQATGSLRDAISLFDQLASTGEAVTSDRVQAVFGTAAGLAVRQVATAIGQRDLAGGLTAINACLDGGSDPRQLARQIVEYLRGLLLFKMGNAELVEGPADVHREMEAAAAEFSLSRLVRAIEAFHRAAHEGRTSWQPGLALELALVEAGAPAEPPPGNPEPRPQPPTAPEPAKNQDRSEPASSEQAPATPSAPNRAAMVGDEPLTFQVVTGEWKRILKETYALNPRAQALLNSGRPLGLQDGALVVGFTSDLLREKMEQSHNLDAATQALANVLQRPLGVRCVLTKSFESQSASTRPAPPLDEEGMVATAVRDLGAQVVDVKPSADQG
jgi:DNA polymerase III subunit gamma/tau